MQRLYKQFFYVFSFFVIGWFFLLGNITFAADPCGLPSDPNYWACSSCINDNLIRNEFDWLCQDPNTTSNDWSTIVPGTTSDKCLSPIWATRNSITGICSCPTGQKEVNGKCESCAKENVCCGVQLNTSIPFIGSCIESEKKYAVWDETWISNQDAFPVLIGSLTKILISVILITSFILIVVAGVMIASGKPAEGKKMIINVAIGLALLGASWVILHLINPNFFG